MSLRLDSIAILHKCLTKNENHKKCKKARKSNQNPRKRTRNKSSLINDSYVEISKDNFIVTIINMVEKIEAKIGKINEETEYQNNTRIYEK